MLFELTDKSVWSKASMDTTGLNEFYANNKSKYQWGPSVKGTIYKANDEETAKMLVKQLNNPKNTNSDDILKAVSEAGAQNKLVAESGKYEKTRFPVNLKMTAGKYCPYYKNEDGTYTLLKVDEVYNEPTQKTLSEARGYVISEYQEYLEKNWIADLEAKYPVKLNESVIKSMIK
jgi:peptidyl-prolyl cis-trans isomerase SurA